MYTTVRLHLGGSAGTSFHVSLEIMLSSGSGLSRLGDERLTGWKLASTAEAPVSASVSSVVLRDMFPVSSAIRTPTGSSFLAPVQVRLSTHFSLLIRCLAAKEAWARPKGSLIVMAESLRLVSSSFSSLTCEESSFVGVDAPHDPVTRLHEPPKIGPNRAETAQQFCFVLV